MIVDPQSSTPIFQQIASQIRQQIASGVYRPNEALPSQRRLAQEIHVNPNTIQKAYDELAREGFIESRRGAGLFVVDRSQAEVAGQAERRLGRDLSRAIASALTSGIAPQRIRTLFRETLHSEVTSVITETHVTTPPIQLVDVTKEYKGHLALDSLSLEFTSGTTVGLLGPNGAGKTTCLKMMLGLLRPTSGAISILGQDVVSNGPQVRQHIGYVPEDPWLYPWMTVQQVVRFASSMYKSWDDARASELLGQFELPPDRIIKKLSKGMRVKAALVVVLAHRPQVLVLDEPMSGLDPLVRDDLIETLLSARAENTECIVLSSHQIDDVNRLADEVAIIHAGKLLVHSSIDDLLGSTKRVEAVLLDGRLPERPLPQTVWQNIDRRNWSMTVHPFDETMLAALQAENPISSARIVDLSVEQIFKDMIRGATSPCFAH